jgi:hypothetical protein
MKVQTQVLCKSSMDVFVKVDQGKPFQIISLCLFNPSPLNLSDYIVLHETFHNYTTSYFELIDFFLLKNFLFRLSTQQGFNSTSPYVDFVSLPCIK